MDMGLRSGFDVRGFEGITEPILRSDEGNVSGPAAVFVPVSAPGLDGRSLRCEIGRTASGQVGVKPVNQLLGHRQRHWCHHRHHNSGRKA